MWTSCELCCGERREGKKMDPLVMPGVDLKDFPFTPIYRARLFGSMFHANASDGGWRAGVTLWLKSWDQVPAGSLPKDDVSLCRLAELGRDIKSWRKIAVEALHGWKECSDGRLYHGVVAEGVNEAWQRKCTQHDRTEAARAARAAKRLSQTNSDPPNQYVTENVTEPEKGATSSVTGSKGQGQGQGQIEEDSDAAASGAAAPDPIKDLWNRGLAILGEKHRALLGKMRKEYTEVVLLEAIVETERECPIEPVAYLIACCQRRKANGRNGTGGHDSALDILARAAVDHDERQGYRGPAEAPH